MLKMRFIWQIRKKCIHYSSIKGHLLYSQYFVDFISNNRNSLRKNSCLEHVALFENLWLTLCEVFRVLVGK
ncbi:hypothetical protein T12_13822, partial [Trichinella patagoniensis]